MRTRRTTTSGRLVVALATVITLGAGLVTAAAAAGSLTPVGTITERGGAAIGADSDLSGITVGPDGALWFTEYLDNQIGRLTESGHVSEFDAPPAAAPASITTGSDGALWFTEAALDGIGRITTGGATTSITSGITPGAGPADIVAGPDDALWFTESTGDRIGRITTSGDVTEFTTGITPGSGPSAITVGPDHALWFTEFAGDAVARITTGGTVTEFTTGITAGAHPTGITTGPDGALWFTEAEGNRIGRITTTGDVTEFATGISADSRPSDLAVGADGALWFTELRTDTIGRITTDGAVSEYSQGLSPLSGPSRILSGPDRALWFTESTVGQVGRITSGVPGRPSGVESIVGTTTLSVSWVAPSDPGSAPITGYVATTTPGGATCSTSGTSCTVSGLTPGTHYTVTVVATNMVGQGPTSAAAQEVGPATVASAPRGVTASPRNRAALVSWTAPLRGGSEVTRYTVRAAPGGRTCVTSGSRRCLVTGLVNGRTYRFTVRAATRAGTSNSSPSAKARIGTPTPPTNLVVSFPAKRIARLHWSAPLHVGSGPVAYYQITISSNGGRTWVSWARLGLSRTFVRHGLQRGHTYVVRVRARNGSGPSRVAVLRFTQAR